MPAHSPLPPFTFSANSRYWLLVDVTAGNYRWLGSAPSVSPTGVPNLTFLTPRVSNDNGASYVDETNIANSVGIRATPVPFGFDAGLGVGVLGAMGWLGRRWQKLG